MKQGTRNTAASVKQRLLNLSNQRGEDFNVTQVRYASERLLYRLSVSDYAQEFLLKGAMLFVLWEDHPHRPTRDVDLLFLQSYDMRKLEEIFREVVADPIPPDGLSFDQQSVRATEIREGNTYGGVRIKMLSHLDNARIPVQVDIGLGDAVYPEPEWVEFTTLLDLPSPRIRAYPMETVVAEKLQAIVELGNRNTRLKDFFDILYLQQHFVFSGHALQQAIWKTFRRRKTSLPVDRPGGLSATFGAKADKQWKTFLMRNGLAVEESFEKVCDQIAAFTLPSARTDPFEKKWIPGSGWVEEPAPK